MGKTPLSIRIIYRITSIVYYIAAFATALGLIVTIAFLAGADMFPRDYNLAVEMPVEVDFEEIGAIDILGEKVEAKIVDAVGQVQLKNAPPSVTNFFILPLLVIFPLMFWLIFLFHRFIRNVSDGIIFDDSNFYLLRKLSYGLAIIWLVTIVYFQVLKYILFQDFQFAMITLSSNSQWDWWILGSALFTWVLSHVFLKGLELQKENELTV